MNDLTRRIRAAQVQAGEQVVLDDLRARGLAQPEVIDSTAADESASAEAVPVDEWPKETDERVLIYVVHQSAQYEEDAERRKRDWEGWHVGYWTDFNGGGWVWHGMIGTITHVAPLLVPPVPASK